MTRTAKPRSACDRCYKLKERCQRPSACVHCARCQRLGLDCSTIRPVKTAGRRVILAKDCSGVASNEPRKLEQHGTGVDECLDSLPDLQPGDRELLQFLLTRHDGLDDYVVCSSFQAEHIKSLATQLQAAPASLKDACLASALAMKQLQAGSTTDADRSACIGYISKAMSSLWSLPIASQQDTVRCHTLGSILAFSVYSAIGVGVPDICRYCLDTRDRFSGTTVFDAREDPWQSFLVLLETMDCLVHRRIPSRRIEVQDSSVDHRLGLCLPLLPYYQDLCTISNSLQNTTDLGILARLQNQLDGIQAVVSSWQPSQADQLIDQFDSGDIINLLAQAKVYRLGALLVAHRLRYPFGSDDILAEIWSKEAMMELEMAKRVTKRPLRFVTLPFIVAAVEVRDASVRARTLEQVDDYVDHYAPFMRKATKTFLERVWRERDLSLTCQWFDSIHKPCPVMDFIDTTCF